MREALVRDLRYALRTLTRTPGATGIALVALALGIGANTAMFSVVYAVLLRPLPVRDAGRLVAIVAANPKLDASVAEPGYTAYAAWARTARAFESMTASWTGSAEIAIDEATGSARHSRVSANYLPTLGVAPALGRNFTADEDQPGAPRVVLLSYEFWRRRFGADPSALGRFIVLNKERYTVVGVVPRGFHIDGRPAEVYTPFALSPNVDEYLPVSVYGRLKPGVTVAQAHAEMQAVAQAADKARRDWTARVFAVRDLQVRGVRLTLLILLASASVVLLIACANVASLLLARAGAQRKEIAIRIALGAGRASLVRQFLTENVALALAGGALGLILAAWCVRLVPLIQTSTVPTLVEQTRIDPVVFAFTLLISMLTGILFGAGPAMAASQANVEQELKEGGRMGESVRCRRAWNFLIVSETALALVLIIAATLLARSFLYLRDEAPGFRVNGLLTASLEPPFKEKEAVQLREFYRSVVDRVRRIPGVESATVANSLPLTGDLWVAMLPVEGHPVARPRDLPILWQRNAETGYFRTLGVALRRGRFFSERDDNRAPLVVIVNETTAHRFWPGQDPIGKRLGGAFGIPPFEVIGVVGNVRHMDQTKEPPTEVYFHLPQMTPPRATLAVRADARMFRDPMALAPAVRHAVLDIDKNQKLTKVAVLDRIAGERIAPKRIPALIVGGFAALALLLAGVGIYGVLSFSVVQRTHEIGVRVALGARRGSVVAMIVRQAAGWSLAGIAAGLIITLAAGRVLRSLLYGVSATDPAVFAAASMFLLAIGVLAGYIPARRAARVDPLIALRHE